MTISNNNYCAVKGSPISYYHIISNLITNLITNFQSEKLLVETNDDKWTHDFSESIDKYC